MNAPTSRVAYTQYYEVFDRALEAQTGVRLRFNTKDEALFYRSRMHQARKMDRKENLSLYPEGHKLHGASAYDICIVREPRYDAEGQWWLYVERNDVVRPHIEPIPEKDDLPLTIDARPVLRLELAPREPAPVIVRRLLGGTK